jgi:hypothetical protein
MLPCKSYLDLASSTKIYPWATIMLVLQAGGADTFIVGGGELYGEDEVALPPPPIRYM